MAHLTNDNRAAYGAAKNRLGGIQNSAGRHLVVVKQLTNWTNKEFVVTPTSGKYFSAWAGGEEAFPGQQGGVNVFNDTNTLLNSVKQKYDSSSWMDGYHAIVSIFSRADGPYANKLYDDTGLQPNSLSEFGNSICAYKLNLKHLHLSKMKSGSTRTYEAYVRVWGTSLVFCNLGVLNHDGILISGQMYNGASQLKVKLTSELPDLGANVVENNYCDSFDVANTAANNGRRVSQDVLVEEVMGMYDPFDSDIVDRENSSRIYTLDKWYDTQQTNYYHDFKLTNSDNLNVLDKNPGTLWMLCQFHVGNAFSSGQQGYAGIASGGCATLFIERAELVLKCTSSIFM